MANIWVYDIETSPNLVYTWGLWDLRVGLGQIVDTQDILCFAATRVGGKRIESHTAWDGYDAMIGRLHDIMDDADYLVGYNHINYDNKHARAAMVKAGMPPPSPHRDIDLLRTVKKHFKFQSNKLGHVCEQLGLNLKTDPGGFQTWRDILDPGVDERRRDAARRRMVRYCRNDVRITAQLFTRLTPYIDGLNLPLTGGGDAVQACTRCGSDNIQSRGWAYTTSTRYRRYRCMACGGWMRARKSERLTNPDLLVGT